MAADLWQSFHSEKRMGTSGSGAWFIKRTLYTSWLERLCKPSSLVCGTGNCEEMEEPVEPAIGEFLVVIF